MKAETLRSAHRCETCQSYTEIVLSTATKELHACPVCQSVAILNRP